MLDIYQIHVLPPILCIQHLQLTSFWHQVPGILPWRLEIYSLDPSIQYYSYALDIKFTRYTGLSSLLRLIVKQDSAVFGHIALLDEDTCAHQALRHHIDISLG